MTETAVQYLKRMVFPYLTHEEKMLTGKFFYEAEMMEKEEIINACNSNFTYSNNDYPTLGEQYYNETYGKASTTTDDL